MGLNRSGHFTLPTAVNILTAAVSGARHGSGNDLPWPYGRSGRVCPLRKMENARHGYSFCSSASGDGVESFWELLGLHFARRKGSGTWHGGRSALPCMDNVLALHRARGVQRSREVGTLIRVISWPNLTLGQK